MNYKLINKLTGEEHICQKVTIDGFDYYVSDEKINSSNYEDFSFWFYNPYNWKGFIEGYNKCHKSYPFSEEDMIEFAKFSIKNNFCKEENRYYQYWELLQLWKEQKPKTIWYE